MTLNSALFDRIGMALKAWAALGCLILSVSSTAFGSDKCGSLDRASNAIHLAQILYPELQGGEFSLQFSEGTGGPLSGPADVGSFLIAVDKPQWHPPAETSEQPDSAPELSRNGGIEIELPLYLQFTFVRSAIGGKAGTVVGRELSCWPLDFINQKASKQIHEAAEVINANPEWTDEQDLEAARKFGLRFGPDKKADLLRILPLQGLSSIYGPLEVTEAGFRTATPKEPGSYFTDLHWYVTAKRLNAPQKKVQITVEPFHGKITALSQ